IFSPAPASMGAYFFFYANFYNLARTLALFLGDIIRELAASLWQILRNERPRVRRFGIYPLVRAATTSLLRELSTFTVAGDIMRGVPAVYTTYIAYDEVAHHSGIARGDTLRVLRDIDRDIGRLQRVATAAPRPYHLVVLSDHGQSQGATFRQRYGLTLGQLVSRLISGEIRVLEHISADEGWQSLRALLSDFMRDERASPVLERTFRRLREDEVTLDPDASPRKHPERVDVASDSPIVLASGNLGLISFPQWEHRATLEDIEHAYPDLVSGLARHPGISFVMIHSEGRGPVVIGPEGLRILNDDRVEGTDPLASFGPHVPDLLRRTDGFVNAPDILVNSMVDPETGEVAAFEELVGSHGGLGGTQTMPFLLHPAALPLHTEHPIGASALHDELMRWMACSRERHHA
ncbi:MAG TPA: alkaline phosphatase family protein, partial [Thermomicrobiales bacterium]|nr:alkaline phosphatase family protein [Thermomicrobiales bacterium]